MWNDWTMNPISNCATYIFPFFCFPLISEEKAELSAKTRWFVQKVISRQKLRPV